MVIHNSYHRVRRVVESLRADDASIFLPLMRFTMFHWLTSTIEMSRAIRRRFQNGKFIGRSKSGLFIYNIFHLFHE